jgi:hypothetical protein
MTKKKFPKKIEVGGKILDIKILKKMPKDVEEEIGPSEGWCDWNNRMICLIEQYTKQDNSLLFHELGHAAADCTKVPNPMSNETFARPFFAIFYAALKNAGLLR